MRFGVTLEEFHETRQQKKEAEPQGGAGGRGQTGSEPGAWALPFP